MMSSQMPWESLKAETVRAIFRDLGLSKYVGKRDDMIQHLQEVEQDGLEAFIERFEEMRSNDEEEAPRPARRSYAPRTKQVYPGVQLSKTRIAGQKASTARKASGQDRGNLKFDGVVLPAPPSKTRTSGRQVLVGVVIPTVNKSKIRPSNGSGKRKAQSDAEDETGAEEEEGRERRCSSR